MNLKNILENPWLRGSDKPQNNFARDIVALTYGGLTALMIMTFFVVMWVAGFSNIIPLLAFNIIFFSTGIFFALKRYSGSGKPNSIEYFEGLKIGVYTGFIASILLSVFVVVCMGASPQLLHTLNQNYFGAYELSSMEIAVVVALVSLPVAFIATLICMQYFKKD